MKQKAPIIKHIRGNKTNYQWGVSVVCWGNGAVRIEQSSNFDRRGLPGRVMLLTARQVDDIARYSQLQRGRGKV